ncbi:arylamine N-acetyltransferase [Staphylococcus coagulans]|uniref:arylamine N-acetyltransferase n=1 Tax=Staphylococcus coagulans TaxID=74706 RepID=UPI0024788702|nr:arylamine N-acetyltransferase [Staphylococcus coagulans]
MNFEALESHIGLTASEKEGNTLEDLTSYIRKFLYTIPFEAIDIYNGRTISTDVQTNIDKFTKNIEAVYVMKTMLSQTLI